ncbi:MAG: beta-lactamase family protein [Candidatus Eremiobacteraeota bacterium]|nr:beta-lactamase family protein [Candidatus Eremiobacteraeota bacterium]
MLSPDAFAALVADAAREHNVPGVAAAYIRGSEMRQASTGVLNLATQVAVTDDAVFQVGSITKVFTGTLTMQLVEQGRLELDAPVRRYLPDLQIAHRPIDEAITIRHLLSHTSGIVGDLFCDVGRNDDSTARYVERCAGLQYLTPPGGLFSYCNSGFGILGRLIEVITGATWAAHLRTALLEPLGIAAITDAEEAPRYRTAMGHVVDDDGALQLTPTCWLPRGAEAAGARLTMSPAALLKFARMHLSDGVAANGTRLLSAETARAMRESVVRLPLDVVGFEAFGLSWGIFDSWHPRTVGHDGGTIGQSAFMRLFPEWDAAVCVLTNATSGGPAKAFDAILRAVLAEIGPARIPEKPTPNPDVAVDPARFVGTYETYVNRMIVSAENGELRVRVVQSNTEGLGELPDHHLILKPLGEDRFLAEDEPYGGTSIVGFTNFENGRPRFYFGGYRLAERVSPSP